MAGEGKTGAPLIKELGTAQNKLSPFIYFGLLPRLLLIVALFFAGLVNGTVNAATDPLEVRVGSELEFPPYAFIDESGRPVGFSLDLIKTVADVMGLSIKISTGPWDTVWNELVAGRLDVLPIVAKLSERQRMVDFSLPHTETYDAFFVRQGNPQIQNIEAARGKEVAVMRSDAAHHALLERNFQGRLVLVDTIPEGLFLISSGKHDAFLCSKLIGTMAIKKHGLRKLTPGPLIADYKRVFSFAVKKGDAELLEKLNQGLLIIKTNGQYDQIYDKWLTADDPWRKLEKYLWPAIAIMIAIALIVGFWLVTLQLVVKERTRQLSKSNEMLRLAQEGLEERVAQRTVEISNANVALQSEIIERKRAEEALRESEDRFRKVFENAAMGIAITDWEGRFQRCNPAYCALLSYTEEELRRIEFAALIHPEDRDANLAEIRLMQAGKLPFFQTENRYLRKDGQPVWVHKFVSVLPDATGRPANLLALVTDVTERKQAQEVLRESEERHRTILQTAMDGFWRADLQGRLLEVNEAYCRMSGYSEQELLAMNVQDIEATETPDNTDAHMQKVMAQGEDRFETRHRRKDGSIFEVEVSVQYKPTERGLLVAFLRDITKRKRAEETLRKRTAELEFANRELEAFSYSVSHDLKAPVRAIQGFSRILMAEHADKLDAAALRLLQVITTNTKLMHHLIDDLLALSRLGRLQIRKSVINLTAITNKVFEKLRSQAPERDLQLTLGDLPPGLGDQSLLYQVMENLLANAVKFTKSRKTAVIEVGGRTEGKENIYFVKDNGAGFDERYLDKLFRPFQRLHGGDEYEGSGVGLAIVQRIIQRHGSRVWAEGKVGEGATFYFALPKNED